MGTIIATADTAETIAQPNLPTPDEGYDGYDYMEKAEGAGWSAMGNWGEGGYDLGSWPYVMFFVRTARDSSGMLYGFGEYCEGDLFTDWFRGKGECNEAITRKAFGYWKAGQGHGPAPLPATVEELAHEFRVPSRF